MHIHCLSIYILHFIGIIFYISVVIYFTFHFICFIFYISFKILQRKLVKSSLRTSSDGQTGWSSAGGRWGPAHEGIRRVCPSGWSEKAQRFKGKLFPLSVNLQDWDTQVSKVHSCAGFSAACSSTSYSIESAWPEKLA